jgi:hypothetical protein
VLLLQTTVREALVVSATLRLYEGREKHLLEAFVDDVLELVELTPNRDTLVGWGHRCRGKVVGQGQCWGQSGTVGGQGDVLELVELTPNRDILVGGGQGTVGDSRQGTAVG